jgi:hypothetical protein
MLRHGVDAQQPSHRGSDAVRTDHEVIRSCAAIREIHVGAMRVLSERDDGLAEQHIDARRVDPVAQHGLQVRAQRAHRCRQMRAAGVRGRRLNDQFAVRAQQAKLVEWHAARQHLVQNADLLECAQSVALYGDPVSDAVPDGTDLHQVDPHAALGQGE